MGRYNCEGSGHKLGLDYCEDCFQKQVKIDRLTEENKQLKAQLRYRDKKDNQDFFGSSTPSSKKNFKSNSTEDNQTKAGGAKLGHKGNGRKSFSEEEVDEIITRSVDTEVCPDCGGKLEHERVENRSTVDMIISEVKKILIKYQVKRCSCCKKTVENKPLILSKNMYGNELIIDSLINHYIHGIPLKRIEEMAGPLVKAGNLIKSFHRIAESWETAVDKLQLEFRNSPVKHADETGWRTDGDNGYSWFFGNQDISIFKFEDTRSSRIPAQVLGTEKIPGVLVVDRYCGYNKVPCDIQYCYAHLLRTLQDLAQKFPKKEVQKFVETLAPLIASAIKLRKENISDAVYYQRAEKIKEQILDCCRASAKTIGIQTYQNIFIDSENRLFQWVKDRRVPADNNRAERELRPTVIARKVSFGSQSAKGAKTRGVIMTIAHTAAKRLNEQSIQSWLRSTLESYIKNPTVDIYSLLPPATFNSKP